MDRSTISSLQVGEEFSHELVIESEAIKRFATLAGDTNPLHHDEDFARNSRFKALIASGSHTSALMVGTLSAEMAARANGVGLGFSVRLRRAVRAGDIVRISWQIESIEPRENLGGFLVVAKGKLVNQAGDIAITAVSESLVYDGAFGRQELAWQPMHGLAHSPRGRHDSLT